jgi:DNA-binding protein YbaB
MKGMMPDMGNMGDMMKMMPAIAKAKAAMENAKGAGQSRGGLVKANSHKTGEFASRISSLTIDKSLIDPSKPEALEKAVMEAINDTLNNEAEMLKKSLMDLKMGQ